MAAIALVIFIAGLGFFSRLLFQLAVYALPCFSAVSIGLWCDHAGSGPIGAIALGVGAGAATLAGGHIVFARAHVLWLRVVAALLFAAPAAVAGYSAMHGVAELTLPSGAWRTVFSLVSAIIVGMTAWVRIAAVIPVRPGRAGIVDG